MSKREAISQHHCAGRTDSEIVKLLKVTESTVCHVVERFKELGTSEVEEEDQRRIKVV